MAIERLDESKPYGSIGGHHQPPGFDRPAHYEQGGAFFDMKGRLIKPNTPLTSQEVAADEAEARAQARAERKAREQAEAEAAQQAAEEAAASENAKAAVARQAAGATPSWIAPPYQPPEFDRPAHYQIGDRFLDEHGREIVPGKPLTPQALAELNAQEEDVEGLPISALIAQANALPFNVFKAAAEAILGKTCPKSYAQILERLRLLAKREPNLRTPRVRPAG